MKVKILACLLVLIIGFSSPISSAQLEINPECPIATHAPISDHTPEQIHIQLTQNPSEMLVIWATPGLTDSVVEYGIDIDDPTADKKITEGTEMCYDHNMVFHSATMVDLLPGIEYTYRVGDNHPRDWSDTFKFTTQDLQKDSFEFIAFGDHGMSDEAQDTANLVRSFDNAELVILSGDISYANGDQSIWDDHGKKYQTTMANIPWMMAPGNHENETVYGYGFDAYETRFEMPSSSGTDFWHSFDYGGVHFVAISTEHPYYEGSEQLQWIKDDLATANANRDSVPWIVIYGHKPLYTSHGHESHDDTMIELRTLLEPILFENSVDLAIWGHDHFYERTWPVVNENVTTKGINDEGLMFISGFSPIHIVAGIGGKDSYEYAEEQPEWSFHRESTHGVLHISVNHSTETMHVEYVRNDYTIGDSFLLVKESSKDLIIFEEEKGIPAPGVFLNLLIITIASIFKKKRDEIVESY
ncbi:MAG: hypothetical protein CMB64_04030 [Euryarchaeota archaeon]|nr:hypothetical protein [Euryarchaeota archaeon]